MEQLQELVESIKQVGLLHPLTVVEEGDGYRIVAGHRRYEAARLAGLEKVPVNVVEVGSEPVERYTLAENIAREDISPVDLGYYFKYLVEEKGMTIAEVARMINKSHTYVSYLIKLVEGPEWLKEAVQREDINWRCAVALLGMPDEDTMMRYAQYIARSGATLAQVEEWVKYEREMAKQREEEIKIEELAPPIEPEPEPRHKCLVCERWLPLSRMEYVKMCRDCLYEIQKQLKGLGEEGE